MNDNINGQSDKEFLKSNELGQRLLVADTVLRLIQSGELSQLKRILTNAVFVARAMTDRAAFETVAGEQPDGQRLIEASEPAAYLIMNLLGGPQATLFYARDSGIAEQHLFSAYFPRVVEMIYGAIGLDVQRAAQDPETIERILRSGVPKRE